MGSRLDLAGQVLILTGTLGTGKTTAASILAREPGTSKVHLHTDDFWGFVKHGRIASYLPEAHEQNRTVMFVLARAAEAYARGGYGVVLDGVVGPWFLPSFLDLAVPLEVSIRR
jgi:predicted kinase